MRPEDRKPFCEIVLGFAELKGKALSAPALGLYWGAMQHWTIEDFRAAAEELLRSCPFMPTPADFEKLKRARNETAGEAWLRVLEHTRGAYRAGAGLDAGGPIDRAVGMLGGYKALAFHEEKYLALDARRFMEVYDELVDVEQVRAALPQLGRGEDRERARVRQDGPRAVGAIPFPLVARR